MSKEYYKEFRPDGWPLCPRCGEDELYSLFLCADIDKKPTQEELIADGLRCYSCHWASQENQIEGKK